ncbi:hypothetical protein [Streptomyces sp. NPDC020298]|uniref:hypothetical protein n=1 Tax=unclassified Streptomyces TaxID=2593676 RepID=UPI0033D65A2D
MAHTVFTAALTGAMAYDRGATLLRVLDLRSDPARLLADHGVCYPPADPGAVLEPLYPDRLAEDYLALTFPGHAIAVNILPPHGLLPRHRPSAPAPPRANHPPTSVG